MANLGATITLVDQNGSPTGTTANATVFQLAEQGVLTSPTNPFPISDLQVSDTTGSNTAAAAAAATASLPAVAAKTNYIRGFCVSSGPAAAAVTGVVTVTNVAGGTLNFQYSIGTQGGLLFIQFQDAIQAPSPNLAINVNLPAITGGSVSAISVWGNVL